MKRQLLRSFLGSLVFITALHANTLAGDLAIVVGKVCPVESLTLAELRRVWLCEHTRASNGVAFAVTMRAPGSPERAAALREILNMSEAEFERYYLQAIFAGTVLGRPKIIDTTSSLKRFVNENSGAIAYVAGTDLDASLKVVKIDGRLPGDPEYPLKLNRSRIE